MGRPALKLIPISVRWEVRDSDVKVPEASEPGSDWLVLTSVVLAPGLLTRPSDSAEVRDGGKACHF